jgi:hypothetical protein
MATGDGEGEQRDKVSDNDKKQPVSHASFLWIGAPVAPVAEAWAWVMIGPGRTQQCKGGRLAGRGPGCQWL